MLDQLDAGRWLEKYKLKEFPEPERVILKYPVLLCHGYGAITVLVKPSPLYDVAMLMRTHNVLAFAPNIVPYARIETRAESWSKLIHRILDELECPKINIIAHSMGGLDARYAISRLDMAPAVESLTTVSTPHRGTSLAELMLNAPETIRNKVAGLLDWIGDRVYPNAKSDSVASAEQLTREYVTSQFNPAVPDADEVSYYSYSSAVGKGTDESIQVIARYQNNHVYQREGPNDGMVSVQSAQWGTHIKTGNLSHLEQMNFNTRDERQSMFREFWLDIIKKLQASGH